MIKLRKQRDVDKNNARENSLRVDNDYHIGDKVIVTDQDIHRKLNYPTKGPCTIIQVYIQMVYSEYREVLLLNGSTSVVAPLILNLINWGGGGSAVGPVYPVLN